MIGLNKIKKYQKIPQKRNMNKNVPIEKALHNQYAYMLPTLKQRDKQYLASVHCETMQYTKPDILSHFGEYNNTHIWKPHQRGGNKVIECMYTAFPAEPKRYYLMMLLLHIRGATSFSELCAVNEVQCTTFKKAAQELGLLDDDTEWERSLAEASLFQMLLQLKHLFVSVSAFEQPEN